MYHMEVISTCGQEYNYNLCAYAWVQVLIPGTVLVMYLYTIWYSKYTITFVRPTDERCTRRDDEDALLARPALR